MPRGSLAPFLHYIRSRRRSADGDADLLNRFAADRDEDAFAELVRRHGPLVWGVARQVLGHDQDAEDAFQATFLLLARNAKSVRTAAAVAGWLHGTAWRVANKARTRATASRKRERSVRPRLHGDPATEIALRELQALLHQEIAALPAKYRTPFVLCILEGRARSEVAHSLGWNEGTLSTRLAWARNRLRTRLLRRGVDIGAALAAIELTRDATAAVPGGLTIATVAAARTGVVSTTVAALTHGAAMTMKRAQIAALGLLLGGIAIGSSGLMGSDPPQASSDQPKAKTPAGAGAQLAPPAPNPLTVHVTVSGTATGPDGKPVKGANVVFCYANYSASKVVAKSTTVDQGRYEFRDAPMPVQSPEGEQILVQIGGTAEGFAMAWSPVTFVRCPPDPKNADVPGEHRLVADPLTINLTFARPSPLQGRIVDEHGQPLAGATVVLDFADNFRRAEEAENTLFVTMDFVVRPASCRSTTDRNGRFRLDVVPPGCITSLTVKHPDYADASLYAATEGDLPADLSRVRAHPPPGPDNPVWNGAINVTLFKPRSVPVTVLNDNTGKPVPKANVGLFNNGLLRYSSYAVADGDGKAALRMPPGECRIDARFRVRTPPPPGGEYVWYRAAVTVTTAAEQPREVRLVPAGILSVEVVDAGTGRPLAGANVFTPVPEEQSYFNSENGYSQVTLTDKKGAVRFAVRPGQRRIDVSLVGYETVIRPTEPVEVPAGGEVKLRFRMRRTGEPAAQPTPPPLPKAPTGNVTISGTATGPDGKPIKGAKVRLAAERGQIVYALRRGVDTNYYPMSNSNAEALEMRVIATATTNEHGQFRFDKTRVPLYEIEQGHFCNLAVCASEPASGFTWRLTETVWFAPPGDGPESVQLAAWDLRFTPSAGVLGRVFDEQRHPVPGATVRVETLEHQLPPAKPGTDPVARPFGSGRGAMLLHASAITDKDGWFRFSGLPRDSEIGFEAVYPDHTSIPFVAMPPDDPGRLGRDVFNVETPPHQVVDVVVASGSTGKPISKASLLWSQAADSAYSPPNPFQTATSDEQGKARLRVVFGRYDLWVRASKYVQKHQSLLSEKGKPAQVVNSRLGRCCTLAIEIVEAGTSKPIEMVGIYRLVPAGENRGVAIVQPGVGAQREKATGPIRQFIDDDGMGGPSFTDAQGKASLQALPGPLKLQLEGSVMKAVPGGKEFEITDYEVVKGPAAALELTAGETVQIRYELRKKGPTRRESRTLAPAGPAH